MRTISPRVESKQTGKKREEGEIEQHTKPKGEKENRVDTKPKQEELEISTSGDIRTNQSKNRKHNRESDIWREKAALSTQKGGKKRTKAKKRP